MAALDLDRYCVGCDSDQGYSAVKPGFCTVCWDARKPPPRRLLDEIRAAYERGWVDGTADAYDEGDDDDEEETG